jgi:predicted DNA-binding antitoxin AbrB/MazE fold protein
MANKQIDPSELNGVGLVFVRKEDPINLFVLSVTKQLYSLIGFYYSTNVSGKKQINVILSDVCGIVSSEWTGSFTLNNLIYDDLVTQLSVRELLPVLDDNGCVDEEATKKRNGNFKAIIAKITNSSMGSKVVPREWVKQLFGYEIPQPTAGYSSVEFVNSVIMETQNWDKIKQNGKISVEGLSKNVTPGLIPKTSEGKNHIFTKLGGEFKQVTVNKPNVANKLIQSYLAENGVFGPLKSICLPNRELLSVNLRREQSISQHKHFLTKAVSAFVKMILEDKKFFNVVVDGINHNTIMGNQVDEKLKASVYDVLQTGNELVCNVVSMLDTGKINYDDLDDLIKKYKHKVTHTLKATELTLNHAPSLKDNGEKIIIVYEGESQFEDNLQQLYTQLKKVKSDLNKGKSPKLNVNTLIENVNYLIRASNSKLKPLDKLNNKNSFGCVLSTSKKKNIPIYLKSGQVVNLPTVGYDISKYNCSELREILHAIDILADQEYDYSDIRSSIASKYSQCTQVSCKHH